MPDQLTIRDRDGTTRQLTLETDNFSVGRSHDNDLCFPSDASLSRRHFVLERTAGEWWIRDLRSKNGTMVNGLRISDGQRLHPGDRIKAGQILVVYGAAGVEDSSVEFIPGNSLETPTNATLMTSLEGVLSGETPLPTTYPDRPRDETPTPARLLDHPKMKALIQVGRELVGKRPLKEIFELILDLSIDAVGAERGVLMTLESDKLVIKCVHGEGFRISTTVRDQVLEKKASVLVRNTLEDDVFKGKQSISEQHIRTMMAVPLQTEEKVIGLLYVDSRAFNREFSPSDLELLTVLANHAAMRIEHEWLAEVERQEQMWLHDLEQASQIQARFQPTEVPVVQGVELAGRNTACRTVGGDYYDFLTYPDGRVAVMLGDVAGKGMPAALLMSDLRARVQVLASQPDNLGQLMGNLNDMIDRQCPRNRFISFFFSVLDPATGRLNYCNAGHNPPVLVHGAGKVERLEGGGAVLGMLPGMRYEERAIKLEPGALCALFSDGVTEAVNHEDEEFGESRLIDLLVELHGRPAQQVVDGVLDRIAEWAEGTPQADDITLSVVRRIG